MAIDELTEKLGYQKHRLIYLGENQFSKKTVGGVHKWKNVVWI